ncbi:hypothetical protein DFJ74DRAFT_659379 [Hyaloraphidium curvatum]|nr:hypothetical protein DFJ74DRAFT_659379 [Hyaloraphidium curvatum]
MTGDAADDAGSDLGSDGPPSAWSSDAEEDDDSSFGLGALEAQKSSGPSPLRGIDTATLYDAFERLFPEVLAHQHGFGVDVCSIGTGRRVDASVLGHSIRLQLESSAARGVHVTKAWPCLDHEDRSPHSVAYRHLVALLFDLLFSPAAERERRLEAIFLYVSTSENRIVDKKTRTAESAAAEARKLLSLVQPVLDSDESLAAKTARLLVYAAEDLSLHCSVCGRVRQAAYEEPGLCGNDLCKFQAVEGLLHADLQTELRNKYPGLRVLLASALAALEDRQRRADLVYPVPPAYIVPLTSADAAQVRELDVYSAPAYKKPRVDGRGPLDDDLARRGLAIDYEDLARDLGELYALVTDPHLGRQLSELVASGASNRHLRAFLGKYALLHAGLPADQADRATQRILAADMGSWAAIAAPPDAQGRSPDRLFVLATWLCRLTALHFREEEYDEGSFARQRLVGQCNVADLKPPPKVPATEAAPAAKTPAPAKGQKQKEVTAPPIPEPEPIVFKPAGAMVLRVWNPDREDGSLEPDDPFMAKVAYGASQTQTNGQTSEAVLLFHGSSLRNWLSLLALGPQSASGTRHQLNGAAHGAGVYFGKDFTTANGYSNSFGTAVIKPPILHVDVDDLADAPAVTSEERRAAACIESIVAVCRVSTSAMKDHGWCVTVPNPSEETVAFTHLVVKLA